jgi:hypothetical protein
MVEFIHMYATYKRVCGLPHDHTSYDSQAPNIGRRAALLGIGLGSLPIAFPEAANAGTPVRAPLPNGPPDPSDWAKLIEATKLVESWSNNQIGPSYSALKCFSLWAIALRRRGLTLA